MNSDEEREKLLRGASSIEQFEHYYQTFFSFERLINSEVSKEVGWFADLLLIKADTLDSYQELKKEKNREKYIRLRISALLMKLSHLPEETENQVKKFVAQAVMDYSMQEINSESREFYTRALRYISWDSELYQYIVANWNAIINELFRSCGTESHFDEVKDLFDELGQDYEGYLGNADNRQLLGECLNEFANAQTDDWVSDKGSILSENDWEELKSTVIKDRRKIFSVFDLDDDWYDESEFFNDDDFDDLIERNTERRKNRALSDLTNTQKIEPSKDENLVKEIEVLFNGDFDPEFVKQKAEELYLPF